MAGVVDCLGAVGATRGRMVITVARRRWSQQEPVILPIYGLILVMVVGMGMGLT